MANVTGLVSPAHRTAALSYYAGLTMVFRLMFSVLAVKLMYNHAWLAIWLGCAGYLIAVLWSLTLPSKRMDESFEAAEDDLEDTHESITARIIRKVRDWWQRLASGALALITRDGLPVLLVLVTLVLTTVAWQSQMVLDQFIRFKYGWSWPQVWETLQSDIC